MKLSPIVEGISEDLRRAGALGGEEASRVAEILVASVEPSISLRLLDALQTAAHELAESAPGTQVDVRLEGRDPVLSLTLAGNVPAGGGDVAGQLGSYIDGELSRLTLRLPEGLKSQIEEIAMHAGASLNSWIVMSLARSLDRPIGPQPGRRMPRRITGYVQG